MITVNTEEYCAGCTMYSPAQTGVMHLYEDIVIECKNASICRHVAAFYKDKFEERTHNEHRV